MNARIRVVSSFGRPQWEAYASALLPRSLERWSGVEWQIWLDPDVDLGALPIGPDYRWLAQEPEHGDFMRMWAALRAKRGEPSSYLFDAGRFAHKVFALTSAAAQRDADFLVWLDADVETLAEVTPAWLADLCGGAPIAYLGRKDIPSAETAFLMFDLRETSALDFLARLRTIYTSGDIFAYREWIDGFIFARLAAQLPPSETQNLSAGLPGLDVFERTRLGERLRHYKGPRGKFKIARRREP